MKKLRYLITLPWDIVTTIVILAIHAMWGSNLHMEDLTLCTHLRKNSWPMNPHSYIPYGGWYQEWAGTTFGHAIMYRPKVREVTKIHEAVHVHQLEASMLKSLVVALLVLPFTGKLLVSFAIWATGYPLYLIANWATAWIRGAEVYRGSVHEEHAYAVGDLWYKTNLEAYRARINRE